MPIFIEQFNSRRPTTISPRFIHLLSVFVYIRSALLASGLSNNFSLFNYYMKTIFQIEQYSVFLGKHYLLNFSMLTSIESQIIS